MRRLRKRDVPAGAALSIAALVMLASAVTGEDRPEQARSLAEPAAAPARPATAEDLDLEKLKRPKAEIPPPDLFAPRPPMRPPVAVAAAPATPPAPMAPPLPFKYLGRLVDGGKVVVFLEGSQRSIAASAGETLDGGYLVESIGDSIVQFVYLPLGTRQTLVIPAQH